MKILVLGCGRVGQAIARDLAGDEGCHVIVTDTYQQALSKLDGFARVSTKQADTRDVAVLNALAAEVDLIIGALPSALGFETLERVIATGKPYVDISFFEQDPFALDALAKRHGTCAVVDCGIAPGLDNIMLGYHTTTMDRIDSFACYVGGLPRERHLPWEYKAGFAPIDVIAEYTRPARLVENGEMVTRPALSQSEYLTFPEVGTLEASITDGLRTLVDTVDVPNMKELTLRYPGHYDKIRFLQDAGFLSSTPITVNGETCTPLAVTGQLLCDQWLFKPGEADLTVMRVIASGREGDRDVTHTLDVFDQYNPESGLSSMARSTGYTCTAIARCLLEGRFKGSGVFAPEHVGQSEGCYHFILDQLKERGISVRTTDS